LSDVSAYLYLVAPSARWTFVGREDEIRVRRGPTV